MQDDANPLESAALDRWQVVGAASGARPGEVHPTRLLGQDIAWTLEPSGVPRAWRRRAAITGSKDALPAILRYGFVWTCLGTPPADLFPIPEYAEPDRRNIDAGTFGVQVSAPRAVENFLDMGHFPYVHTDYLGVEPHTEVKDYQVDISASRDEILATRCLFWQPRAALAADAGMDVEYVYRVPHPYCAILYKSCPSDPSRRDVIALFVQPVEETRVNAYMLLSLIDLENSDTGIRHFQQTIFGQDKPILENQFPKRLPLDPRAETPIRADKSSIAYRRWLREQGVRYGTIW